MSRQAIPNVILRFEDSTGNFWVSAALIGPLIPGDPRGEKIDVERLKDRALALTQFTVITDADVEVFLR